MRADGDLLLEHVGRARSEVLLCAPFIKAKVLKSLFDRLEPGLPVQVVTRWNAEEVAAGVSDLEVFEIVAARGGASLSLLDHLHAKLYVADGRVLAGSANLTAPGLGWSATSNLEILAGLPGDDPSVLRCLEAIRRARPATEDERSRVAAAAQSLNMPRLPAGEDVDEGHSGTWLPRLGAPARLYNAYMADRRERLTASALEAADHDLRALGIPPDLGRVDFEDSVRRSFVAMPAIRTILDAASSELRDDDGIRLVAALQRADDMAPEPQWLIVREWMTHFLRDDYEIAPQNFIIRPRPGSGR